MTENELRELESNLAVRLMGWKLLTYQEARNGGMTFPCVVWVPVDCSGTDALRLFTGHLFDNPQMWMPAEYIGAAWMVAEAMLRKGWRLKLLYDGEPEQAKAEFSCPFGPCPIHGTKTDGSHKVESGWERTPMLAICLAALKAVEGKS